MEITINPNVHTFIFGVCSDNWVLGIHIHFNGCPFNVYKRIQANKFTNIHMTDFQVPNDCERNS